MKVEFVANPARTAFPLDFKDIMDTPGVYEIDRFPARRLIVSQGRVFHAEVDANNERRFAVVNHETCGWSKGGYKFKRSTDIVVVTFNGD